ncbi:hypothetical protein QUW02_12165 [Bacteroides eggerthii]|uniref:Uncharacterized protein n=1 Tax=Bacteroides eggerthii TaxID=28111 RepID=A0ABT7U7Z7_9BACE|nr:hypothetical protein [Bacteroides eggerthii]
MVKANKDKQLKVPLVNGSPHRSGNTFTALSNIPPTLFTARKIRSTYSPSLMPTPCVMPEYR